MNGVLDSIMLLRSANPTETKSVFVSGYYQPGDGGGGCYIWQAESQLVDNAGTVIASDVVAKGKWCLQHRGVGDFRSFGILDDSQPADDALDALVNDPAIVEIHAFSNLLFQRRHLFRRSGITLDFHAYHLATQGIEPAPDNDPFAAVLFFQGQPAEYASQVVLTKSLPEQTDVFPVENSSEFRVGDWYAIQSDVANDKVTNNSAAREIQKLVQITAIIDKTHVRIGYCNGWPLAAGRVLSWRRVEPVQDITVRNLRFIGAGADQITGSHPLAFEYAVRANVQGIHSTGSFWPVIMRRWNTHYLTQQCSLNNPPDTASGGAGYLTQQIYCLYGHISDCYTANARHLNDFTASAYCRVENCHASGQQEGPFVTHGQYEHDLTYTGNSGLMTFANSGDTWGNSACRIHVCKHVCAWFVAKAGVSDLTLEDVTVITDAEIKGSGQLHVNADGLQMSGCTADGGLFISQHSARSARPNLITGGSFTLSGTDIALIDSSVYAAINFNDTCFSGLNGHTLASQGRLSFSRCQFQGGGSTLPILFSSQQLSISLSHLRYCHFTLSAPAYGDVELVNLQLEACILDFSGLTVKDHTTLLFCQNRLTDTALIAFPPPGNNVINALNHICETC